MCPEGILVASENQDIIYCNQALLDIVGASTTDELATKICDIKYEGAPLL
jgi:PAS domain-containing protein